jgi:mitogen-activated protein kinase 1/3
MEKHIKKHKKQANNENTKNNVNIELIKANNPDKTVFDLAGTTFIIDKKYSVVKKLGQGAYGVVCSCKDNEKNILVAMKKIQNAFEDLIDAKRIVREIRLLHFLNHPSIIKLFDVEKPKDLANFNDIYFATEYMDTDLHKVIYSKQPLSDSHYQYFIYQLIAGVNYLHSANVIHRDLKPQNILVNKDCQIKICDFGLGRGLPEEGDGTDDGSGNLTEYVTTRWYRAPEVILCPSQYSKAMDIWSIGCIFAELMARCPIFRGENYLDQIKKINEILGSPDENDMSYITDSNARKFITNLPKNKKIGFNQIFPNGNPLAIDLLEKMLCFNPQKRINIEQCLNHPYFKDIRDKNLETTALHSFDWSFDKIKLTKPNLQKLVYEQSLYFHPC